MGHMDHSAAWEEPTMVRLALCVFVLSVSSVMALAADPPSPDQKAAEAAIARGDKFADEGKFDEAIKEYDEAIKLDPKNALGFRYRAWCWSEKGDRKSTRL